jgi:hypothetical protein
MRVYILIIAALLLLPLAVSQSCTTSYCGVIGSSCEYFKLVNGTCQAITNCSSTSVATVWSNSSNRCVSCHTADSVFCTTSCQSKGFYYNTSLYLCLCSIPNCGICSSPTTCVTCYGGYKNNVANCTPVCSIPNCLLC